MFVCIASHNFITYIVTLANKKPFPDDGCVSYAEFTAVWTVVYQDSVEVATKFVTNMDMDHDGCLDDIEALVNGARNNQHLKIGMTSYLSMNI